MTDIERVARAICRANCPRSMPQEAMECQVANAWDMWVGEAVAALQAIREPSPGMVEAGNEVGDWQVNADFIWAAMIDKALGE